MERFTRSFTPLRTTAFLALFLLCLSLSAVPAFAWSSSQANVSVIGGTGSQTGLQSVLDPSGNIYILGNFTGVTDFDPGDGTFNMTATGTQELFVTKLDPSGNFLWANKFTSQSSSSYSSAGDLTVDSSGNVFVAGAFTSDVDLNPGLDTATVTSAGQVDMFFVKLDSSGAYIWGKRIGGAFNEYVFAIAADSSGNSYYSGCFTYTVDFDPGAGYFGMSELAGNGYTDAYITKLDSSGSFVWAKQLAGNNGGCAYGMSIDPSGNLLQFGNFSSTVDFDPGSGTNSITSSGLDLSLGQDHRRGWHRATVIDDH
jgi:hypothetical protein